MDLKYIIILAVIILALGGLWTSYWLFRWTRIRWEPVAQTDEQAQDIAEFRTNITRQVSAAFCSLHNRLPSDKSVEIAYQHMTYSCDLMIMEIGSHWLKAYFDWYTHKLKLEYFIGGDEPHTYTMRFDSMGFISTGKLLSLWYNDFEPLYQHSVEHLLTVARQHAPEMWQRISYEDLVKDLLTIYAEQIYSIQDLNDYLALVNVLAEDEKAREVIENMLPENDEAEEPIETEEEINNG